MSVPLQPQIFAAMAFVTHWVKCAAVGTPDRSRTGRERSASIAFCRVMETADLRDSYDPTKFWRLHSPRLDRKSTRLNSSHGYISHAVFCLKKKKTVVALIAATVGAVLIFANQKPTGASVASSGKPSVAVLAFDNSTGDSTYAWYWKTAADT